MGFAVGPTESGMMLNPMTSFASRRPGRLLGSPGVRTNVPNVGGGSMDAHALRAQPALHLSQSLPGFQPVSPHVLPRCEMHPPAFRPETAIQSPSWSLVGGGRGRYEPVELYNYVGAGRGDLDQKEIQTTQQSWKSRACIYFVSFLLLCGTAGLLISL